VPYGTAIGQMAQSSEEWWAATRMYAARMAAVDIGDGLTGGASLPTYRKRTVREQLQDEVDEWLADIKI
jgi:hypothetical protein